ncbi:MAG TPA: class I mannose-6-phosphate isomerase [Dongiaceae bacterium]|nr:class I mannose-6-phosphate isomerase [Dongiaceae bacterium]
MTPPFRKTTQLLAPAEHRPNGAYNLYPGQPVGAGQIELGFAALARQLASHDRIIFDGMSGVMWGDFRARLAPELARLGLDYEWLDVAEALLEESAIDGLVAPYLGGNDPLFGLHNPLPLEKFFDPDKLKALARRVAAGKRTILYGTGAALSETAGFLVYLDVPKNEIQFRSRAGTVTNLGARRPAAPKQMYKRFYFVDWPPLRRHQAELLPRLDLLVDSQRPDEPTFMSGADFRAGLAAAARSWFRVRPWFEPGPWGGQWMKQRFAGLAPEAPNLAWSFELISPENGLAFTSAGRLLEAAFDWLMFRDHRAVLGDFAARFGSAFPIRFDYLDTFSGGNLSLQCHPRPEYTARHFGEPFTQDETYYITDCGPDAEVYLGFQEGINAPEFQGALEKSFREASELDVQRFVQIHTAQKHGLYLIPNGTIHCSGRNNLVLEISATPYIFTFKMYDWMRLDLDGQPRPLNISRAMDNLYFDRQGERVAQEFIAHPQILARGAGWELTHLPTHAAHFYDVHRFDFAANATISASTSGSPHVLNVVEGGSVVLEVPHFPPQRFYFAETFVVPAAAGTYQLRNDTGQPVKVIKAFLKPAT